MPPEVLENDVIEGNDDDFNAGFDDKQTAPTETPEPKDADKDDVQDADPAPAPATPKYVQITQEQLDSLMATAARIEEIKATATTQIDKAFGKIGGVERLISDLQKATPAGQSVQISEDDFAELAEDYPELAEMQLKGLTRVLAKMNVRGVANSDSFDPEKLNALVTQRMEPALKGVEQQVEQKVQSILLGREHKDWREVVGQPDAQNEFRKWLATQPGEFQKELNTTYDAEVISGALTKFKASVKAKAAISQRQSRISAAVNEKGAGGSADAPADDDDDFNEGFRKG